MKKNIFFAFGAILAIGLSFTTSCDKVEFPNVPEPTVDTTIYPGDFNEYVFPTFEDNPNTTRNALIEDYTGHQCGGCPAAAEVADNLETSNPGRVFVASIHGSPTESGESSFQDVNEDYWFDFKNPQGLEMASTLRSLEVGFFSNPRGNVNRLADEDGTFMFGQAQWGDRVNTILASDLDVNIQAQSSYFSETNGMYLHVETEFINSLNGNYNIVVYAIRKKVVAPQLVGVDRQEDYEHHNVHLGNFFDETWGRGVANGNIAAGTKVQTDFSYYLPEDLTAEDMLFQIIVFDRDTYEIMQVIQEKIED